MVEGPTATGPSCECGRGWVRGWADAWLGRVWRLSARGVVRRGHAVLAGALRASGDISLRTGTFDAVGDGDPVPVRARCPRLEQTAPGRAECPRPLPVGPVVIICGQFAVCGPGSRGGRLG